MSVRRTSETKRRWYQEMMKAQKGACHICGSQMTKMGETKGSAATFDHLRPLSDGGTDGRSNLKLAHRKCNNVRGSMPVALALEAVPAKVVMTESQHAGRLAIVEWQALFRDR